MALGTQAPQGDPFVPGASGMQFALGLTEFPAYGIELYFPRPRLVTQNEEC